MGTDRDVKQTASKPSKRCQKGTEIEPINKCGDQTLRTYQGVPTRKHFHQKVLSSKHDDQ